MVHRARFGGRSDDPADISTPSLFFREMDEHYWRLTGALRGGSQAMREESKRIGEDRLDFLPFMRREEKPQWQTRLANSFLEPAYDEAVTNVSCRPFVKPVQINGELPPEMDPLEDDVDGRGTSLTVQAHAFLDAAVDDGVAHLFVDFPATGGTLTRIEERRANARPTIGIVRASDLLDAIPRTLFNGREILHEVRIKGSDVVRDGFASSRRETILRYVACQPETWGDPDAEMLYLRYVDGEIGFDEFVSRGGVPGFVGKYVMVENDWVEGEPTEFRFPVIPLVSFFTNRKGWMLAQPFFWILAELNLQHWQKYSVHCYYVDFAQITGWKVEGADPNTVRTKSFGPGRVMTVPPGATLSVVSHGGEAYGVGKDFLDRLESRMDRVAKVPFIPRRTGDPTATGDAIREAKSSAPIHAMIRSEERAYESAFRLAAMWYRLRRPDSPIRLPDDFSVDVFSNFSLLTPMTEELQALRDDFDRSVITEQTYLTERKIRGLYREDLDVEAETSAARIQASERFMAFGDAASGDNGMPESESSIIPGAGDSR